MMRLQAWLPGQACQTLQEMQGSLQLRSELLKKLSQMISLERLLVSASKLRLEVEAPCLGLYRGIIKTKSSDKKLLSCIYDEKLA